MKRKFLAIVMSILLPTSMSQQCYAIPDLGSSSRSTVTSAKEEKLGKIFLEMVRTQTHVIDDPILHDYLNTFGNHLVSNSHERHRKFDFFIVDSDEVNAFAGPAAHIGVNSATILLAQNEHEFAAVLSHEISHVTQHHLARAMERAAGNTLMSLAGIAAAILIGSVAGGNAGLGGLMASQSLSAQSELGYSRDNEREADRFGLDLMYHSGYDPNAMPTFLHRMAKRNIDLLDGRFSYLRTHPVTEDRIADIKQRVEQYPKKNYNNASTYQFMQTRLDVLSGDYSPLKLAYYQHHDAKHLPAPVQDYAYGLMQMRAGRPNQAEKIFANLRAQNPNELLFILAHSEALSMQNKTGAATQLLQQVYSSHAQYPPLVHQYSELLIQQKQTALAQKILQRFSRHHPHHVPTLILLSRAQAANGHLSQAYVTRAKLYKLIGQEQHAKMQYQQAFKFGGPNDKQFIETEMQQ